MVSLEIIAILSAAAISLLALTVDIAVRIISYSRKEHERDSQLIGHISRIRDRINLIEKKLITVEHLCKDIEGVLTKEERMKKRGNQQ